MKDLFERLNDEEVDLSEFEGSPLSDIEKKAAKKRIKAKLRSRSNSKRNTFAVIASLAIAIIIGVNSNYALADIPIIGGALEEFVYSKERSLKDYKTVIGQSEVDNGMRVTLNEVILDEGQLLISSTFHTDLLDEDLAYNWYSDIELYINGKEMSYGGGGGPSRITNSTVQYFWAADIKDIELKENHKIKIVFKNLSRSDSKKMTKGKWGFEFTATGEKLMKNRKSVPIYREFTLDNGQKVKVEEIILTPVSTRITYKMENVSSDLYFKIEDQDGMELQEISGQSLGYENYNRFIALEHDARKLKIIPYILTDDDRKEQVLYDEIFEIDVN